MRGLEKRAKTDARIGVVRSEESCFLLKLPKITKGAKVLLGGSTFYYLFLWHILLVLEQ